MLVGCIAREVMVAVVGDDAGRPVPDVGASAARHGERMERIYRDLSMGNSHRNTLLRDFAYREVAKERLGIPRQRLGQQRSLSGRAASQGIKA